MPIVVSAQDFEIGFGMGLNFSQLNVVDSSAGQMDSLRGYKYEISPVQAPGYTLEVYGLYHLENNLDLRFTLGADWIAGKVQLGREGLGGNVSRTEDLYFEGWFKLAPGIAYNVDIVPDLISVSAGLDVIFGLSAINIFNELPSTDTVVLDRDFYRGTSYNTFQNAFNIFVKPHAQINVHTNTGRKFYLRVQYEQGILPFFSARTNGLNFIDPISLEPVLSSGYLVEGRASRYAVLLGFELPWAQRGKRRPAYRRF